MEKIVTVANAYQAPGIMAFLVFQAFLVLHLVDEYTRISGAQCIENLMSGIMK